MAVHTFKFIIFPVLMLTKHLIIIYTHLKWVFNFLLNYPFYMLHDSHQQPINIGAEFSTLHYEIICDSEEHVDCTVCLHKIGEGEDEATRVLRCDRVFHSGCLDRWAGFRNATCTLCRGLVAPRMALTEFGAEVSLCQFCSARSDDREAWWLR